MEWYQPPYRISTDPNLIDSARVVRFLQRESYWGQDITTPTIERSLTNSLCFSVLDGTTMIGFARVITDYAVFGYLEDVFIDDTLRGQGIGKWLMQCVLDHPDIKGLKKLMLATADAQELYRQYGFNEVKNPEMVMERYNYEDFPQAPAP
jgi:N-acetylglutamate synthase-like GNAT family acetyltransferase